MKIGKYRPSRFTSSSPLPSSATFRIRSFLHPPSSSGKKYVKVKVSTLKHIITKHAPIMSTLPHKQWDELKLYTSYLHGRGTHRLPASPLSYFTPSSDPDYKPCNAVPARDGMNADLETGTTSKRAFGAIKQTRDDRFMIHITRAAQKSVKLDSSGKSVSLRESHQKITFRNLSSVTDFWAARVT